MKILEQNIFQSSIMLLVILVFLSCKNISNNSKWKLVWEDNFDGPKGQLLDSLYWDYDIGTDWGNKQLEYDTDRAKNVSLDGNGNLVITAYEEEYNGQAYYTIIWHS